MGSGQGGEDAYTRRLLATALTYAAVHHLGLLPAGSARFRGTSWVDWADLLLPYAVLGLAGSVLAAARAGRRLWLLFAAGGLLYAQGHGIHLAANSIGNFDPGPTAHLWDELAGHAIWYAGVVVVAAALAATMTHRPATRSPVAILAALAAGATWATNALGGHLLLPGLVVAAGAGAYGAARRHTLAGVVGVAGAAALVILAGAVLIGGA